MSNRQTKSSRFGSDPPISRRIVRRGRGRARRGGAARAAQARFVAGGRAAPGAPRAAHLRLDGLRALRAPRRPARRRGDVPRGLRARLVELPTAPRSARLGAADVRGARADAHESSPPCCSTAPRRRRRRRPGVVASPCRARAGGPRLVGGGGGGRRRARRRVSCVRSSSRARRRTAARRAVPRALGHLLAAGVPASRLAYIKPATQCEAPDLLAAWCRARAAHRAARAAAHTRGSRARTHARARRVRAERPRCARGVAAAVDAHCAGRDVCVIDGVGFPGVGSCVGCSNADVAAACRAPRVLAGRSGVGSAIDGYCSTRPSSRRACPCSARSSTSARPTASTRSRR